MQKEKTNIVELKKQKKKIKFKNKIKNSKMMIILFAIAVAVVAAIVGYAIYSNTDAVIDESISSEEAELILMVDADSGFPVSYTSSDIIDVKSFASRIFIISKRLLTCVSSSGDVVYSRLFSFSDPEITVSEKYGLVYDKASTEFFIFNHKGIICEGKTENRIITGKINNNGDALFAVKGKGSPSEFCLYNKTGEHFFGWSCGKEYIVAIDFDNNSDEVICGAIGSENSGIYSTVYRVDVADGGKHTEYRLDGKKILSVDLVSSSVIAVCSDGRYVFKSNKNSGNPVEALYDYNIVCYDSDSNGNTAVVTSSVGGSAKNRITIYNKNNEISYVGHTDSKVVNILCRGKKAYVLTDSSIQKSESDGNFEVVSSSVVEGEDIFVCKSKLFYFSDSQVNLG